MKKALKWLLLLALLIGEAKASATQNVALKTNAAYWAVVGSPNLSMELTLGRHMTADRYGGFFFLETKDPRRVRYWMVQPELRYWFCDTFNGHFIGLHAHGGQYNLGGVDPPIGWLTTSLN